jgi:hypothetical protein
VKVAWRVRVLGALLLPLLVRLCAAGQAFPVAAVPLEKLNSTAGIVFSGTVIEIEHAIAADAKPAYVRDVYRSASDTVRTVNGEAVTFTRDEPVVFSTSAMTVFTDQNGMVTLPISVTELQPVKVVVQARAGQSEVAFLLRSMWNLKGGSTPPTAAQVDTVLRSTVQPMTATPRTAISLYTGFVVNSPNTAADSTDDEQAEQRGAKCESAKKDCQRKRSRGKKKPQAE